MEDALAHKHSSHCRIPQVLILVLMEDALARGLTYIPLSNDSVLILVLMEDALAREPFCYSCYRQRSLNPCFNGRCTRTIDILTFAKCRNSLNPCFNGRCTRTQYIMNIFSNLKMS